MEIFVRVNDPQKLVDMRTRKYSNSVLTDIKRRHRSAQEIMMDFMACDCTSEQRWNVIEDYFLGREDSVRAALQSHEPEENEEAPEKDPAEA